jgi:type IV secretory pathway component VirB8
MNDESETYPRVLNGHGCVYGQTLKSRFDELKDETEKKMEKIEDKLNKILWAMVGVLVSLTTASILAILNLVLSQ